MTLATIWVELGVLVLGMAILALLFILKLPPYNKPYYFANPRTWKNEDGSTALDPVYNYDDYNQDIPDPKIIEIYCDALPEKCIYSRKDYLQAKLPPVLCESTP